MSQWYWIVQTRLNLANAPSPTNWTDFGERYPNESEATAWMATAMRHARPDVAEFRVVFRNETENVG